MFKADLKTLYLLVRDWYNTEESVRGPLKIGIRGKEGRQRSVATMLLFAACCRHFQHTVFVYAPGCDICTCPSWYCENVKSDAMWLVWIQRAAAAKNEVIQLWRDYRDGW